MKQGLEVEEGKVVLTVMVLVTLIKKRKGDYTWTGQFLCLSDCHAKKTPTPAEKQVLQKPGLGLKNKSNLVLKMTKWQYRTS